MNYSEASVTNTLKEQWQLSPRNKTISLREQGNESETRENKKITPRHWRQKLQSQTEGAVREPC